MRHGRGSSRSRSRARAWIPPACRWWCWRRPIRPVCSPRLLFLFALFFSGGGALARSKREPAFPLLLPLACGETPERSGRSGLSWAEPSRAEPSRRNPGGATLPLPKVAAMSDGEKLNLDSIIGRLLEGEPAPGSLGWYCKESHPRTSLSPPASRNGEGGAKLSAPPPPRGVGFSFPPPPTTRPG